MARRDWVTEALEWFARRGEPKAEKPEPEEPPTFHWCPAGQRVVLTIEGPAYVSVAADRSCGSFRRTVDE